MNIALVGYGKMGKTIEQLAKEKGHHIVLKSDSKSPFKPEDIKGADVVIEFSKPKVAVDNFFKCFEAGVPIVTGTTGWYNRFNEVESEALRTNSKFLHSTNFSIGVNIFFKLNLHLAAIMDRYDSYEPVITETHHTEKLDSPSGTALTLAEDLMYEMSRKTDWTDKKFYDENELQIQSYREPDVPGTHEIIYTGLNDELSIKHTAKDRNGFALGSILAAKWLMSQTPGVYSMKDFLKIA